MPENPYTVTFLVSAITASGPAASAANRAPMTVNPFEMDVDVTAPSEDGAIQAARATLDENTIDEMGLTVTVAAVKRKEARG